MTRHGRVNFQSNDKHDSSSVLALAGRVSPTLAARSKQLAETELPQARQPLTYWNQSAIMPAQSATASRYEELMAEAETLLHQVKSVQPVNADKHKQRDTAMISKQRQAASRNKLAIVRVRVSLVSSWLAMQQFSVPSEQHATECQCNVQAFAADTSHFHPATGCRQDSWSPSGTGTANCRLFRQCHQAAAAG